MFQFGGCSNFNGRFDFFEWSAPYYENPDEVFTALNELDLKGKRLAAIHVIGSCKSIGWKSENSLHKTIRNAGIELGEKGLKGYPHLDNVRMPWNISVCEPIQLVFEDGSSLEIFPFEDGGARIGVNSIPVGMTDGLMDGGVDASKFFEELIGRNLSKIELIIKKEEEQTIDEFSTEHGRPYKSTNTKYIISFGFESPYKLKIISDWQGWYDVCAAGDYWRGEQVPYKRNRGICKSSGGPWIVNGRDIGGTFWIIGISSKEERESDIPNLDCFGMSIDDTVVGKYLTEFLYKHFDPTIQEETRYAEDQFDWYGGNLYTFESMRKMLDDIYRVMKLLQEDYDNPELSKIKEHWSVYPYTRKRQDELSDKKLNIQRKNVVPDALAFYERFCWRMEQMLKVPGNDIMSFAGP